ncbi:Pre-mRNA-splicing factor CWC21 [Cladophialophora carrionii]|uniref:Pre-mRNA-splicing factor CWC21 n=1 Tax=Cladophialophora carrionii TaxID=86049 RepID=A0A1C1D1X9_9EURO|nr:Pre-mRNA-splicing factor CWC21 [Cladophialophora carrionii]
MSSNVGLSTPRGSGTSGYVQRNLSLLKPRAAGVGVPYSLDSAKAPKVRKPDQEILNHDRLREIEVKVLELREKLEDEGHVDEDKMDEQCDRLREKLTKEMEKEKQRTAAGRGGGGGPRRIDGKGLKSYQVHELAEAKERESERLRRALGLKPGEIPEDGEHPMARQEKRRREREGLLEKDPDADTDEHV